MAQFFRRTTTDQFLKGVYIAPANEAVWQFEQPKVEDGDSVATADLFDLQNQLVVCEYFGTTKCGVFLCLAAETEEEFLYEVKKVLRHLWRPGDMKLIEHIGVDYVGILYAAGVHGFHDRCAPPCQGPRA